MTKTESESETWDTQSREQQQTNRELDVSLKLGKQAECKDKALGTVINRWLEKFHISQQKSLPACNLAEDFQTGKGLLTKGWKSRECGHSAAPSSRRRESCLSLALTEMLSPNICAGRWTTPVPPSFPSRGLPALSFCLSFSHSFL